MESTESVTGLEFKTAEIVAFQLAAQYDRKLVADDGELILQEAAVNRVGLLMRQKIHARRRLNEIAGAYPRSQPPRQLLFAKGAHVLDKVDIERIACLTALQIHPVRAVEIRLDLNIRAFPLCVLPARQKISSGGGRNTVLRDLGSRRERSDEGALSAPAPKTSPCTVKESLSPRFQSVRKPVCPIRK